MKTKYYVSIERCETYAVWCEGDQERAVDLVLGDPHDLEPGESVESVAEDTMGHDVRLADDDEITDEERAAFFGES